MNEPKSLPPKWFGEALAIAWPRVNFIFVLWYKRFLHRCFISKNCPACKATKVNKQLQKGS